MHAGHRPQKNYLLSGPIMLAPERKQVVAEEMADHLLADGRAFLDRGDSIRLLLAKDYSVLNVMLCVDDARHAALQRIIAKEMSEP